MKKILLMLAAMMWLTQAFGGIIIVEGGKISGIESDDTGVTVYKGIPFAAPPVGDLRWKTPQPIIPWQGVRVCDRFAPAPIQVDRKKGGWKDYPTSDDPVRSEDCLYLNVWTPTEKSDKPLPVMVWIYGGGFHTGSTDGPVYRGDAYAKKGVILVTVAYRLGVFGFLAHPLLSAESGIGSGNYGLYDQLEGIKWVKRNITTFGGDPDNITVFGQSAGSRSLQAIISSPLAKDLFQKAIHQSGCGIRTDAKCLPLADNEKLGEELFASAGISNLEDMRALDAIKVQDLYHNSKNNTCFRPSIDGNFLEKDLNDASLDGNYLDIQYMIGYTKDDVPAANFKKAVSDWALNHDKLGRSPAYVYCFSHPLPGGNMGGKANDSFGATGAVHSVELGYVFGEIKKSNRPMTEADYELSERMVTYWTNFAKTGNPNGVEKVEWKPYMRKSPTVFILDVKK